MPGVGNIVSAYKAKSTLGEIKRANINVARERLGLPPIRSWSENMWMSFCMSARTAVLQTCCGCFLPDERGQRPGIPSSGRLSNDVTKSVFDWNVLANVAYKDSTEANNGYSAWISECLKENSLLVAVRPAFGTLGGVADNVTHYTYDSAGFIMDAYKYVSANKSHVAVMEVPCYGLHQVRSFVNSREPVYMLPETCDSANANDVALFIRDTTRQLKLSNVLFIYTDEYKLYVPPITRTITTGFVTLWKIDVGHLTTSTQLLWQHVDRDIHCVLILAELAVENHLLHLFKTNDILNKDGMEHSL
ncbi:hypothetical protein LSAT2_016461 [Lamellibrachia satsuma]|nr:hypothetical protein LSAT2_016461 [Lamellibrachia satsuma]